MPQEPHFPLPDLPAPSESSTSPPEAHLSHVHSTWARTFHSRPLHFYRPTCTAQVQHNIALARQSRRRVVTVGSAHSPSDLTCTNSYMLDLHYMNSVLDVRKANISKGEQVGDTMLVQAGISLHEMNKKAAEHGLTLPIVGSIDVQSLAGAIATATHGGSLKHGLLSQYVRGMRIVLADSSAVYCSATQRSDLFKAALVSLGALGVVTEIEYEMIPDRRLAWTQELVTFEYCLEQWERGLWSSSEFAGMWWQPYRRLVLLTTGSETEEAERGAETPWYASIVRETYQLLLWMASYIPSINPWVERTMWALQTRRSPGHIGSGVAPQREALTVDCLYSQFVNEWALPLHKGPEALRRLDKWIQGDPEGSRIPFDPKGVWVHSPIEARVTDGSSKTTGFRGFLDPTEKDSPTLYINAILYRPYGVDPPYWRKYYEAFEWLMQDLGGRPHWAKCFQTVSHEEFRGMYGANMEQWVNVRNEVDPQGMFVGPWHRRALLGNSEKALPLEEQEAARTERASGGALWVGRQVHEPSEDIPPGKGPKTARSEESFDSFGASTDSGEQISKEEVIGLDHEQIATV